MRQISGYRLWLGHVGDVRDLSGLFSIGILAVVDLALNESIPALPRELVYCRFPLIDGSGNPRWLLRSAVGTVAGFLRSDTPTLVYCGAGMSRSPSIAGAAISLVRGSRPEEGLTMASKSGPADISATLWTEVCAAVVGM